MAKNSKVQLVIEGKDNTGDAFRAVDKGLIGISKSAVKAGAAIAGAFAVAAAGVGVKLVKDSINAADAMSKMAQGAGVTTEALSGMGWAAGQSGVDLNALATAMGRLNKGALEASTGTGTYAEVFETLSISATNAGGGLKSADQLLLELADKFEAMPDGAQKSALAIELFGRSGAKMIPFLNAGSSGIAELTAQAERLGLVLTTEQAQASEEFNDNLSIMSATAQGVGNMLAKELLPSMNEFSGLLVDVAENGESASKMADVLGGAMTLLSVLGVGLAATFTLVGERLGAIAAAAVSVAKGDFKGAAFIMRESTKDAYQTAKAAGERIKKLLDGTYAEEGKVRAAALREKRLANEQEKVANDKHLAALKIDRDKRVADNKASNEQLLKDEKKHLSEIENLRQKSLEIDERYRIAIDKLSGSLSDGKDPSYDDASALKAKSRQLNQSGDFKGARKAASEALEIILALQEAGENTYGLVGFAKELQAIEKDSLGAEEAIAQEKIDNIQTSILDLKAEAAALENLPVSVELDEQSTAVAKTQMLQLISDITAASKVNIKVGASDGDIPAFAAGGKVRGPGTGTSDSIVARLSNGEYVMRAAAVRQYGTNLLDNMNGLRMPKFAAGGLVEQASNIQSQQPASIGTLQFHLGGDETFSVDVAGSNSMDDLHRAALKFGRTRR